MVTGIRRLVSVVPHHEDVSCRYDDVKTVSGGRDCLVGTGLEQVLGFLQGMAVDRDPPGRITTGHMVSRQADQPFHKVLFILRRQDLDPGQELLPIWGRIGGPEPRQVIAENDDFAALGLSRLPRQDRVSDLKGLFHRTGGNQEGLYEKESDKDHDKDCHHHVNRKFTYPAQDRPRLATRRMCPSRRRSFLTGNRGLIV